MSKPIAMRDALLAGICSAMAEDERIFMLSADFGSPVLDRIRENFPRRFVNVGIAEQNLINLSAGLALEGYTVFAYAIAPFITMRCYEQIRVNLALLSRVRPMNVNLIGVGAGYSYVVSGPTHQCYEDLSIMRAMPDLAVYSPADHVTAAALLPLCRERSGPKYLRLDAQLLPVLHAEPPALDSGFHQHSAGHDLTLIATGYMVHSALQVAEGLKARGHSVGVTEVIDVNGLDGARLATALAGCRHLATLEEGFAGRGGLDALIGHHALCQPLPRPLRSIGIAGGYRFELGSRAELHALAGIDPATLIERLDADLRASGARP